MVKGFYLVPYIDHPVPLHGQKTRTCAVNYLDGTGLPATVWDQVANICQTVELRANYALVHIVTPDQTRHDKLNARPDVVQLPGQFLADSITIGATLAGRIQTVLQLSAAQTTSIQGTWTIHQALNKLLRFRRETGWTGAAYVDNGPAPDEEATDALPVVT
jgi:hypothetical protein